jgi:hypothetical protein
LNYLCARLNLDASFGTAVKHSIAPEVRFEGIVGTDGQPHTAADNTTPASSR